MGRTPPAAAVSEARPVYPPFLLRLRPIKRVPEVLEQLGQVREALATGQHRREPGRRVGDDHAELGVAEARRADAPGGAADLLAQDAAQAVEDADHAVAPSVSSEAMTARGEQPQGRAGIAAPYPEGTHVHHTPPFQERSHYSKEGKGISQEAVTAQEYRGRGGAPP